MNIISPWSDRPDEFRKPKPAYRKEGSPHWPVGTRAALVAWEDGSKYLINRHIVTVIDETTVRSNDGSEWKGWEKGSRPLFRKIKDTPKSGPREEAKTLVLYGCDSNVWTLYNYPQDTHRLSLTIIGDQVTGALEAL